MAKNNNGEFEVLSPWADVDPMPLKRISPRLKDLAGKKIGLFVLAKPAARPILMAVETKLKQRYPTCEISWYGSNLPFTKMQIESDNKARFEEWVNGVDAVIGAVGD
ncbi:MAG: hypothetical protein ONB05_11230 [candidate division KSB1 bacterium]|nr:hypothetical protein [candidate division KSB1 bacterium]